MKQIPNFFTLLNLLFGCIAVIFIMDTKNSLFGGNEALSLGMVIGSACIFISALVDFLDGFVARLLNATSPMGGQLDSLADVVSFGVVPGLILYRLLDISLAEKGGVPGISLYALPALLVSCAAAWRLAKFNLDEEQACYFKGMPTPAAGLMIASLPMIVYYGQPYYGSIIFNPKLLYTVIVVVSVLMVSNIPLISLKFKNLSLKNNLDKAVLLLIASIAIIFLHWVAVPVIFIVYVLVSLIFRPNKI